MNCFRLVKTVLDGLYKEISEAYGIYADSVINSKLIYLRKKYENLESIDPIDIDYNDSATRFAYVYCYTTAHANIVFQLIGGSETLREAFNTAKLAVGSLGGGPGSDILGILKFISLYNDENQNRLRKLTFMLCDKEQAWQHTWRNIDSKIDDLDTLSVSSHFLPTDVTEEKALSTAKNMSDVDLFTMVYFISEIYAYRNDALTFFEDLFGNAKPGALLFFVDNSRKKFYTWVDDVATSNGLEIVEQEDYFLFQTGADEEKEALGQYYDKFGYPRLQAQIAYRVYRKKIAEPSWDDLSWDDSPF